MSIISFSCKCFRVELIKVENPTPSTIYLQGNKKSTERENRVREETHQRPDERG